MRKPIIFLTLLLLLGISLSAEQITVSQHSNGIRLLQGAQDNMVLELTLGHFESEPVLIDGNTWHNLYLKKAGLTLEAGYPQLPVLAGSVIIPNTARMELSLLESEYVELQMPVAPSKGNLTRDIDPDSVPYSFADFYSGTGSYPQQTAYLTEPFILRDYRGITVRFQPFEYFPATGTLRVYTRIRVGVASNGSDLTNSLPAQRSSQAGGFEEIYRNMFLNYNMAKYPSLGESGRILVIKHNMFDTAILPWVEWKRQNGYTVDVVDVATAGPSANQIKTYIQNEYNLDNGLMFVQIVGDAPQVPSLSSGGGGADPMYALLAGSDNYPDIYVGRFSAQTVPELETQVTRSIHYERDVQVSDDWIQKAMGIASNEGGGGQGDMGESDQVHMENIRTDLLGYGYVSVDQIYQAQGATAGQVSINLNQGRGFVNYVGHGSDTSWGTTGFSNSHVNALTNDYMLPLINSVACVNGNFVSQTCFAEAWLRSVNEATGAPAGALAVYASSINQSWASPMRAQDETVDLLIAEQKKTVGGLLYNGSSKMIEVYGSDGVSMYKTWHIFGDASIMMRTKTPEPLTANYEPVLFIGMNSFQVETAAGARVSLYANGTLYGSATVDASGILILPLEVIPTEPMDLTLTITAFNKVTHIGTVQVLPSTGPYLLVADLVTTDDNNNQPDFGETVTLNVNFNNVGVMPATGVTVTISSQDQYVTILNNSEVIASIDANSTGGTSAGFGVRIANNVPDQHVAAFHILATLEDGSTFEATRYITINAPNLVWGGILVDDSSGNGNGRIDPGESVILTFPITNSGHAQANSITTAMVISGGTHVADPIATEFAALPPQGSAEMAYSVTFSSQLPAGTTVGITAITFSGEYSAAQTYNVNIGILAESFIVDFSSLPWTFTGGDWTIDQGVSFDNSNAARSAVISHNQSTSMSITMESMAPGTISFWKKVSSETSYDFLKFYINGIMKGQWSGTNDIWSQETYPVQTGMNIFKWEYVKDSMVSSGDDCAWIDEIVFPSVGGTSGTPDVGVDGNTLDFGMVNIGATALQPYTIHNTGDAVLIGTVMVPQNFMVSTQEGTPASVMNIVIPAQSSLTLEVSFLPLAAQEYLGVMTISTDDPDTPMLSVSLSGTGQPVAIDDPESPAVTELKGNYPNPFNPQTTISFSLKEAAPVKVLVYNLKGQLVRTLVDESKASGNHKLVFDGRDNQGNPLASGVYFYKMQTGKYSNTRKMILMK